MPTSNPVLNLFKRGATIRRKASQGTPRPPNGTQSNRAGAQRDADEKLGCLGNFAPGPKDGWMIYCFLLTCWIPTFVIRSCCGRRTPEAQRAWREKMGLVSIVLGLMATVGFLTFGFTQTVCGDQRLRIKGGEANNGSLVINGFDLMIYQPGNTLSRCPSLTGQHPPCIPTIGWQVARMPVSSSSRSTGTALASLRHQVAVESRIMTAAWAGISPVTFMIRTALHPRILRDMRIV